MRLTHYLSVLLSTNALKINNKAPQGSFATDRFSPYIQWNDLQSSAHNLTSGQWEHFPYSFKSVLSEYNDRVNLTTSLAGKKIFFIGDSFGREKYKALVKMLQQENGETVQVKYQPGMHDPGLHRSDIYMRHTAPEVSTRTPGCTSSGCPGISLDKCGRPGSDDISFGEGQKGISLHFQFKTFYLTPPSDALIFDDIARTDPDIIFLDIGRWGDRNLRACAYPENTTAWPAAPSQYRHLATFVRQLNKTSSRPIIFLDSGKGTASGLVDAIPGIQADLERCRFLTYNIVDVLNDFTVRNARVARGCKTEDPKSLVVDLDELEEDVSFAKLAKWQNDKALSEEQLACQMITGPNHGFAGPAMEDILKLTMHHISDVMKRY